MSEAVSVNAHYLDRLVAVADRHGVEATEDIVCGQGIKLVAKGGSIDDRVRERLLQHKLIKPLETMVKVVGGAATRPIDRVADALLHRHALLAGLCDAEVKARVEQAFLDLRLTAPLESLLSLFADQSPRHLEHAVGVSLLAAALLCQQPQVEVKLGHMLLAGLMHDVGELYIDPAILGKREQLSPPEWKHVVTHPLVGSSVLRELPGAGHHVADLVLYHHERLDGFGYPYGLRQGRIPAGAQILALAEMLMGVIESGRCPGEHAAVAVKLIPGEFHRPLMERVVRGARIAARSEVVEGHLAPLSDHDLAERAQGHLQRIRQLQTLVSGLQGGGAPLRDLLAQVGERVQRLAQALNSTGLTLNDQGGFSDSLRGADPYTLQEIATVLQELGWRLNELERELPRRAELLPAADAQPLQRALAGLQPAVALAA